MITIRGKGVSHGVAVGRAHLLYRDRPTASPERAGDAKEEWRRFADARDRTAKELEELYEWSRTQVGEAEADIFSIHAMMAQDEDFGEAVRQSVLSGYNASYAVSQAAERFSSVFAAMDDEYMRARAKDVLDVADRIIQRLEGGEEPPQETGTAGEDRIICADDLSPAETVGLDRRQVRAFVTAGGSANSHTAILARSMGIPAVIGARESLGHIKEGDLIAVDADEGVIYLQPSEQVLRDFDLRLQASVREKQLLEQYRNRESRTLDGCAVEICANVGSMEEVLAAAEVGADGIGLFRSEFLYMGREDLPSEEEQFFVYRRALQAMSGRRVIVRTLDVGADKQIKAIPLPREENPALGLRASRVSLTHPELFFIQCRALLRASAYGRLAVMFPLITSCDEVIRLRALWDRAAEELRQQGIPMGARVEIGIMIETPAAALISDRLASLVDFFSIGSNDLTQYTLAVDRQNAALEPFCDPHHEAVLRLIHRTVEAAHAKGIWVGICGELGADASLTEHLLRLGVDEISVAPRAVLPLRKRVCGMNLSQSTASARAAIQEGGKR